MTQVLVIPGWHPTSLNELIHCHFLTRNKKKRVDRDMVAAYAIQGNLVKATGKRRVGLTITLAPRQRASDPDAYWKGLLDSLVSSGLLVDDNRQWCEIEPMVVGRGESRQTMVVLEDI